MHLLDKKYSIRSQVTIDSSELFHYTSNLVLHILEIEFDRKMRKTSLMSDKEFSKINISLAIWFFFVHMNFDHSTR